MYCLLRKGCIVFINIFNCKLICSVVNKKLLFLFLEYLLFFFLYNLFLNMRGKNKVK